MDEFQEGGLCPAVFLVPQLSHLSCIFEERRELLGESWHDALPRRHAIHTLPPLSWAKQKHNRGWAFVLLAQNGPIWIQIVISLMKAKAIISTSLAVMQFKIFCENLGAEWKTQWD